MAPFGFTRTPSQFPKTFQNGSYCSILNRAVRTFTKSRLRSYWIRNAGAAAPLDEWYSIADKAQWESFADVRASINSVDLVAGKLVFNIGGNNYRLIVKPEFELHALYIRWIGTHAEYDRLTKEQIKEL